MQVLWFLPTHGDGRYLASARGGRATGFRYLRALAQAVDDLGFTGALLPTGRSCDDAWVAAAMLASVTDRMKFLVAIRPGLVSPTAAARMAASFDRLSEGRLLINVVTGGDPVELAGDGIFQGHDERYAVTDEFLHVWRRLFLGETVDFRGEHLRVEGARLLLPGLQKPHPPLWFGGSSPAGLEIAGRHVDVSLTWAEPPAAVAEKIAAARAVAAKHGRTLGFGIRLHVIVRETEAEAWAAADDLIQYVTDDAVADARRTFARFDSEGQRRMSELHAKGGVSRRREALEISPNLWAGVGLVRGGAGTALVGDPATVARRLLEYRELGIGTFILSGYPHLEEAYRVAELLFPLLPLAGGVPIDPGTAVLPQYLSPFGEAAAAPVPAAVNGRGVTAP